MAVQNIGLKELLLSLGYNPNDYEKIINANRINTYKEDVLIKKVILIFNCLLEFYEEEKIPNMTIMFPTIFSFSPDNIRSKIKDLQGIGYSYEETIKMTRSFPQLFGYALDNIIDKINYLVSLGYTKDQVMKMTKRFPNIFGHFLFP